MFTSAKRQRRCLCAAISLVALAYSAPSSHLIMAGELAPEQIVKLVNDRWEENYEPLKTIQAKLVSTYGNPKSESGNNKGGQLSFGTPISHIDYYVMIAGKNEQYEIQEFGVRKSDDGRLTITRWGKAELGYRNGEHASLVSFPPGYSTLQQDPREPIFFERSHSYTEVLSGELRSAALVTQQGQKVARVATKVRANKSRYFYLLECPESTDFLPARVFAIQDSPDPKWKDVVQIGWTIEYGKHDVGGKSVLFPKRIVSHWGTTPLTRNTDEFFQLEAGQTITTTASDLKLNVELPADAFTAPKLADNVRFDSFLDGDFTDVPPELLDRAEQFEQERLKSSENVKRILAPLESMVGMPAPTLPDKGWFGGERPDYQGKPYLVSFWAVWCGPCKNDYPRLRQLAEAGTRIVGVHPAGTPETEVEEFVREREMKYPTVLAAESESVDGVRYLAGYPSTLFPYYVVVDVHGNVAAHGHLQDMSAKLTELNMTLKAGGETSK